LAAGWLWLIACRDKRGAHYSHGHTVCNSLSAKCRNCLGLTVETFRKHLKAYLFETAFTTTA